MQIKAIRARNKLVVLEDKEGKKPEKFKLSKGFEPQQTKAYKRKNDQHVEKRKCWILSDSDWFIDCFIGLKSGSHHPFQVQGESLLF
jgi:hypothetical protein